MDTKKRKKKKRTPSIHLSKLKVNLSLFTTVVGSTAAATAVL